MKTDRGLLWDGNGTGRVSRAWREWRKEFGVDEQHRFQGLRHTTRTIAGKYDRDIARLICGQIVGDELDERYDHDQKLEEVKAACEYVRDWLFNAAS